MKDRSLDIILPCYNPPKGWAAKVMASMDAIQVALPETQMKLILVNDGSSQDLITDRDIQALREHFPAFEYILSNPNRGKGFALRKGVCAAKNEIQIYTDIDFPYEEESLIALYQQLDKDQADIVAGVRDEAYYKGVPAGRKRISKLLRWMLRIFLRLEITDTQCGLKGFNASGRALFLDTSIDRFLFDLEFIFLASNNKKARLLPSEVQLKPGVIFSKVNWRILLGESWNFMRIFFRGIWKRMFSGRS